MLFNIILIEEKGYKCTWKNYDFNPNVSNLLMFPCTIMISR